MIYIVEEQFIPRKNYKLCIFFVQRIHNFIDSFIKLFEIFTNHSFSNCNSFPIIQTVLSLLDQACLCQSTMQAFYCYLRLATEYSFSSVLTINRGEEKNCGCQYNELTLRPFIYYLPRSSYATYSTFLGTNNKRKKERTIVNRNRKHSVTIKLLCTEFQLTETSLTLEAGH